MKRQLQGIALILWGILLAVVNIVVNLTGSLSDVWAFLGLVFAVAGTLLVFWPDKRT